MFLSWWVIICAAALLVATGIAIGQDTCEVCQAFHENQHEADCDECREFHDNYHQVDTEDEDDLDLDQI